MSKYEFFPKKPVGPVDHAYTQSSWVRAYRPGGPRWILCGFLVVGQVIMLFVAIVVLLQSSGLLSFLLALVVALAASAAVCTLILRTALTGVWVNDSAIRITSLFRLGSWPWEQVVDVWFDREGERQVILALADGRQVPTTARPQSLDFVGRPEALEVAAESVLGWFELSRRRR